MRLLIHFFFIFIYTELIFANDCTKKLQELDIEIDNKLKKDGDVLISSCSNISPYIYIILVDLDNSENKISITHAKKIDKGYPLKTITELAQIDYAVIAVNGYTWDGDQGTDSNQFANRPTGTVYSKGKKIYNRSDLKEVVLTFSKRTHKGTFAKLYDRVNGENIEDNVTIENGDNSTTSIIVHGESKNRTSNYLTSTIGIGKFNNKNILIIVSTSFRSLFSKVSLSEHEEIFNYFNASEVIRLDGNSASSLYYYGKHKNKFDSASFPWKQHFKSKYGSARHIMYAITVKKVPPLPKPEAPKLQGGVNIVPIDGGFITPPTNNLNH